MDERHKVRVEWHVQDTGVLFVQCCDDRLRHVNWRQAGEEELVKERGGVLDG